MTARTRQAYSIRIGPCDEGCHCVIQFLDRNGHAFAEVALDMDEAGDLGVDLIDMACPDEEVAPIGATIQ